MHDIFLARLNNTKDIRKSREKEQIHEYTVTFNQWYSII